MELSGWGRYPRHAADLVGAADMAGLGELAARYSGLVARGLGRAYGDAAIGERYTVSTRDLDRMRAFDPASGRLCVEAGVSLDDIITCLLPRGYFPPVVPGTRHVTVGGMIAADVHGKNQHRDGSFGEHVESLTLALADGRPVVCSPEQHPELFWATVGGMGLTGVILDATFRLRPVETGWIRQRTRVAENLSQAVTLLRRAGEQSTYSVAWIDVLARRQALGRSLIYLGEHAAPGELPPASTRFPAARSGRLAVPFDLPGWTLNRASVSAFNALYFRRGARREGQTEIVPWDSYFFPLDGIADWNRIYGRRGFLQHQCVVPDEAAESALGEILERVSADGTGSFLAVLKRLRQGRGLMSFPMDGFTLALDVPVGRRSLDLLEEIDRVVTGAGGRLYLAKDARQSRATFEAGYPNLGAFRELRQSCGAAGRLASKLSGRLGV